MGINLSGEVDFWEVYRNLEQAYFDKVEKIIRLKLSPTVLANPDAFSGAEEVLNSILKGSVDLLRKDVFPGLGVYWDEQIERQPLYDSYPSVIVDVVDGARELKRGGTEVTSTLGIIRPDKSMPLAVVSYPFGRERIVDIEGIIYRLPNDFDPPYLNPDRFKLNRRESKHSLADLEVAERYDEFTGATRERLDYLRHYLKNSIKRPIGSIAKMMMSVVTGPFDVFVSKKDRSEKFYDYLIPSKIISDFGGIVTDLQGVKPTGLDMDGIIAASTANNYDLFRKFLVAN